MKGIWRGGVEITTQADAWAYTHQHEDLVGPRTAGRQFQALLEIEKFRERHEQGDESVIPYAVATCARHGLVMPDWLADVVYEATVNWHNFEHRDWDEALGVSRKGKRKADEMNYRKRATKIWVRIRELYGEGEPIDDALFERVAAEMNAGFTGSTCKAWYYRFDAEQGEPLEKGKRGARATLETRAKELLAKRRDKPRK